MNRAKKDSTQVQTGEPVSLLGYSQEDPEAAAPLGSTLRDLGAAALPKIPHKSTVFFLHKWKGLRVGVKALEPLSSSIRIFF